MLAKNEVNKHIWDDVYVNNSSFVHLILIAMSNDQTPSTYLSPYAQLWLLYVNTLSEHGLENSKACNKHYVNSVIGIYPSWPDK